MPRNSLQCLRYVAIVCVFAALTGCASQSANTQRDTTVALAITLTRGGVPSAPQIAAIHETLRVELDKAGYQLTSRAEEAAQTLQVQFTPDAPSSTTGTISLREPVLAGVDRRAAIAAQDRLRTDTNRIRTETERAYRETQSTPR